MIQVIYKSSTSTMDITDSIEYLVWSGTIEQSVRQLTLEYIQSPAKDLELEIGHEISLYYDEQLLFTGKLFSIDEMREDGKFKLVFLDNATILNTCPLTLKLRSVDAQVALREMCNKLKLTLGDVASSKLHKTITCSEQTGKWLLSKLYETDKPSLYPLIYVLFYNNQLNTFVTGENKSAIKIVEGENVISAHYSKNADKVINKVKILNSDGVSLSELEDKDSINRLGTYSHTLVTDSPDYINQGKQLLNKPLERLTVEVVGDPYYISGSSTIVSDSSGHFEKEYIILGDRHTFSPRGYQVELNLIESAVTTNG